ncbi:Retrovirus-related Pol polyprotein from transposon opus [Araneus ventricosus]|uniref:RNA-directed DNA polymerase n=1 Tax=Araneus ventricosus TaxID=182803 RepID=A0A4Y2T3N2_ARAVE|nr:Retrovirus-related Pol polyprotein from transposon opus [Araneus ventricosus]
MSEVGAVQIPVYNRSDPALWFIMCESTFKLAVPKPITESVTKFNYVVSHLPPEVASLVRDILMNPDATDPYTHLKTELINRSGESSQQEIRQRLSGEELGKRKRRRIDATCSLPQTSRRLFIRDRISNISFLVDTGSDVSLIPANTYQKRNSSQQTLFAANSSTINVYGQKTLSLNFNLRRDFLWTFLIADVSIPILGADFLHYFELVPDLRNKCLRDTKTKLQSVGHLKYADIHSVQISISKDKIYHKLLKEFPSITKLPNPNQPVKHTTVHHIVTKGPPVVAKPRRLVPDRLKIAKSEFRNMMHLGHLRPSKSNYASPLHMVPKEGTLDWRPVGDYRALNSQTLKDKYPISCIADFTAELHESKIFSRIDLIKAYHQIPIHPEDIHKTAICTPFGLFESTRMQFGLCNASATFQRFIDEVTRGLPGVYAFVDDILIASKYHEDHYQHLKTLFSRLDEYGLCINVSKCIFDLISQYSTDIRHVQGSQNIVADALSRIEVDSITKSPILNFKEFSRAQKDDSDIQKFLHNDASFLQLELKPWQTSNCNLLCDTSIGVPRPFVPTSFRKLIFDHLHNLAHPGIAALTKLISARYVWPGMKYQIKQWVRCCESCQRSKIQRHTKTPLGTFSLPDARFTHIHIDIVGPLPPSEGQIYLLTIIDRFSRWPEAIPIPDMRAKTICRAIFDTWISRFGCPSVVTSDQRSQLRSSMFVEFTRMLGTQKIKTTPYHPISNGIVERFHRHLKSAIKAHENEKWSELIPIFLLGIRTAVKEDLQSSCSEIVYGTTLRLPCDMIDVSDIPPCDIEFITDLRHRMQQLNPVATSAHCTDRFYIHPSLKSSSHIFLRVDRVQPRLRQPYTGPHKVLCRTDKTITVDINGRKTTVSLDRVKPAHLLPETVLSPPPVIKNLKSTDVHTSKNDEPPTYVTRSGRRVHFPKKLTTYIT